MENGGGCGSGRILVVSQNDIIIEMNSGQHESNEENSDIEMDEEMNGAINKEVDDDDGDDRDDVNSEEKLLQNHNNNNDDSNCNSNKNNNISELIIVKLQNNDFKNLHNGIGVNGIGEICMKINNLGWYMVYALDILHDLVF